MSILNNYATEAYKEKQAWKAWRERWIWPWLTFVIYFAVLAIGGALANGNMPY